MRLKVWTKGKRDTRLGHECQQRLGGGAHGGYYFRALAKESQVTIATSRLTLNMKKLYSAAVGQSGIPCKLTMSNKLEPFS